MFARSLASLYLDDFANVCFFFPHYVFLLLPLLMPNPNQLVRHQLEHPKPRLFKLNLLILLLLLLRVVVAADVVARSLLLMQLCLMKRITTPDNTITWEPYITIIIIVDNNNNYNFYDHEIYLWHPRFTFLHQFVVYFSFSPPSPPTYSLHRCCELLERGKKKMLESKRNPFPIRTKWQTGFYFSSPRARCASFFPGYQLNGFCEVLQRPAAFSLFRSCWH